MDREFNQHNLDGNDPTSGRNEDLKTYDIGEAVAFDENDQVVSLEADEETIVFSEDDLLALADNTEDAAPQMMGLMSAPRALKTQTEPSKESIRNSVLYLVNQQRQRHGKHLLRLDSKLTQAAQSHSEDMAHNRKMSHLGSDGSSVKKRVEHTGYGYSYVAENVARGQDTPREVMISWLRSSGHRRNLLSSKYTEIGIGVAYGPRGPYWTQVFARES